MSDTAPIEGGTEMPDLGAAPEAPFETTGGEVTQSEAPPAEPIYDYLDLDDETASKYVKVKVDGQEVEVPLREALDGYQRQADYTRGKQALAEQRQQAEEAMQVYQAMQTNPGLTIQVLANRAGVSVEEYLGTQAGQAAAAAEQEAVPEFDDPLEREVWETRQQLQAMQEQFHNQQADTRLYGVVNGLKQQYGISDDEAREAVRLTAGMKLGIDAVPMVYRAMAFDKLNTQNQARNDTATQQQQAEQQRQAAAAAAQQSVAPSQISANGVTQAAPSEQPRTAREAIEMAYQQLDSQARR